MGRRISKHGKQRITERTDMTHDCDAKVNCEKVMNRGIRLSGTSETLNF